MKLNLGCGHIPLAGYVNVDKYAVEANVKADVLDWQFSDAEEIVSFHLLEHLTRDEALTLLSRARKWCVPWATLTVEVPDMEQILQMGIHPGWEKEIYGCQEHDGEVHRWGYTVDTLADLVSEAGWTVDYARTFYSREGWRLLMPCALVVAHL